MRLFILCLVLVSCVAPSQHDSARFGTRLVGLDVSLDGELSWRPDQVQQIAQALQAGNALGPTFALVPPADAQVLIRPFFAAKDCIQRGRFLPGTHFIECTPDCLTDYEALRACVLHELGHHEGMSHVCTESGEASDCSPVGFGTAVMNPSISYDVVDVPGVRVSQSVPTSLDLDEYRRTHP